MPVHKALPKPVERALDHDRARAVLHSEGLRDLLAVHQFGEHVLEEVLDAVAELQDPPVAAEVVAQALNPADQGEAGSSESVPSHGLPMTATPCTVPVFHGQRTTGSTRAWVPHNIPIPPPLPLWDAACYHTGTRPQSNKVRTKSSSVTLP